MHTWQKKIIDFLNAGNFFIQLRPHIYHAILIETDIEAQLLYDWKMYNPFPSAWLSWHKSSEINSSPFCFVSPYFS